MSSRAHTLRGSRPTKDARRRRAARLPFSNVDYATPSTPPAIIRRVNACNFIISSTLVHPLPSRAFSSFFVAFRRVLTRAARAFDSHLLPRAARGGENGGKRRIMTQDLTQFDSSQNFESNLIRLIDQSNLINQKLRTLNRQH